MVNIMYRMMINVFLPIFTKPTWQSALSKTNIANHSRKNLSLHDMTPQNQRIGLTLLYERVFHIFLYMLIHNEKSLAKIDETSFHHTDPKD